MANTCIRVLADPAQIKDCKQALNRLEQKLDGITKVFNLAGNPARMCWIYRWVGCLST